MPTSRFYNFKPQCYLEVTGPDARDFLQGQFSNDLSKAGEGEVVYGLWLDRKGKVLADSHVLCRGEGAFSVLSVHCAESRIVERLDAYLIMEDCEISPRTAGCRGICVLGDDAQRSACQAIGASLPQQGGFSRSEGVIVFWGRRSSEPALEFVGEPESGLDKIDLALREGSCEELSRETMKSLAISGRIAEIGAGFGESDLPQEIGLEKIAVSFRKGCYLGQEVMARLHAMGKVRKHLAGFSILGTDTLSEEALPSDLVDDNGKRQGQLRAVAYPESGGLGLGVLSSSFAGQELSAGKVKVRILEENRVSR